MKRLLTLAASAAAIVMMTGCGGGGGDGGSAPAPQNDLPGTKNEIIVGEDGVRYGKPKGPLVPFQGAAPISQEQINQYLAEVNAARAAGADCHSMGVFPPAPPLEWREGLYLAAYEHSVDMAATGVLGHQGSGGATDWTAQVLDLDQPYSNLTERIWNNYPVALYVGENAGGCTGCDGYSSAEHIAAQLASDGHCATLMDPRHKTVGVAKVGGFIDYTFGDR